MKKNKKFEIIEESRFLSKKDLKSLQGGELLPPIDLCNINKFDISCKPFFDTCTVNYGSICMVNGGLTTYYTCPGGENNYSV